MPRFLMVSLALSLSVVSCVTPSNTRSPNASDADQQAFYSWYNSLSDRSEASGILSDNLDRYMDVDQPSKRKKVTDEERPYTRTLLEEGRNPDLLLFSSKGKQEYKRENLQSRTYGWKRRFPEPADPIYENPQVIALLYGTGGIQFRAAYSHYLVIDKKTGKTIDEIRFYRDFPSVTAVIGDRLYFYHQQSRSLYVLSLKAN